MLYDQFPRQVAIPYRINCNNESEFIEEVNKYNGHKRVFTSVYNFNTTEEDTEIILDKVFFDFDGDNAYNSIVSAYKYFKEHNLKFTMFFSGGGFHLYIFLKNYEHLINKKATLANIQHHFKNILNIDVDRAVIGDLARVATIPNTYNTKRKKFCIPITEEDLNKGMEHIKEKASHQHFNIVIYGNVYVDASKFDHESTNCYDDSIVCDYSNIENVNDISTVLENIPDCLKMMLKYGNVKNVGWRGRFLLIVYFKDSGYLPSEVEQILHQYLTNPYNGTTEANHCIKNKNQVEDIFSKDKYRFPCCETIKTDGYCVCQGFCNCSESWEYDHKVKGLYK